MSALQMADRLASAKGPAPRTGNLVGSLEAFAVLSGTSGMVLACFILLGWLLTGRSLLGLAMEFPALNPVTGLVFLAAGLSLRTSLKSDSGGKRLFYASSAVVLFVSILELAGYLGWDTGIDSILVRNSWFHTGVFLRADLSVVLNCTLLGAALASLDVEWRGGVRPAQFLSIAGLAISLMTLGGYGYGLSPLSTRQYSVTFLELNAALACAILHMGILCARAEKGLMVLALNEGPGGSTIRLLLPAMIIVPTALSWVRLFISHAGIRDTALGSSLFALASSLIYIVLILWNASSLNTIARERARVDARMREAAEMKAEFTAIVSHELRTPLTSIKIGIDMVHAEPDMPPDLRHSYLSVAKRNVDRLARLINEVLDFQKLESGKEEFKFLEHDVNEVLAEVAESFRVVAKEKGLEISVDPGADAGKAEIDRDKVTQVLINFTNNALKFAGRGVVTLRSRGTRGDVRLSVEDQGPGISPEDQRRLFRSFTQLRASGKTNEGTGLGLAICRKIIEHHDGRIGVESEPGKGTTFFFTVPRKAARGRTS
jgi:signal transduction histidine kinase